MEELLVQVFKDLIFNFVYKTEVPQSYVWLS